LGRADDGINTGGRKVLPQDVERALDRSLMLRGLVRAGVVVGVEDRDWGQRVEALVTLEPGVEPEEAPALVRAALRTAEVPPAQTPQRVHLSEPPPLLGIGTLDRAGARALAAGRAGPCAAPSAPRAPRRHRLPRAPPPGRIARHRLGIPDRAVRRRVPPSAVPAEQHGHGGPAGAGCTPPHLARSGRPGG